MAAYITDLFTAIDAATSTYVASTAAHIASVLTPIFAQMFTLYVILWGFAMYRGVIEEPIMDGAFRLMKIALVGSLSIGALSSSALITTNILALPDYAASLFGNVSGATPSATAALTLDDIATQTVGAAQALFNSVTISLSAFIIMPFFYGVIVLLFGIIVIFYAAFLIALSKVAIGILVATAPLFFIALMFDGTKRFFESWVGQVINYALTSGLAVGMVAMLVKGIFLPLATTISTQAAANSASIALDSIILLVIEGALFFLVLMQVQSIAASLSSGAALTTMGAVRSIVGHGTNTAMHYSSAARGQRALRADRLQKWLTNKNSAPGSSALGNTARNIAYAPLSTLVGRGLKNLKGGNSITKG